MQKTDIEIMSPIRDWTSLEACKKHADAVYFSADTLSLRAKCDFLNLDNIDEFVQKCHEYDIKAYFVLNSTIYNNDLTEADKAMKSAKEAKVDAVIIWDPAMIMLAKKYQVPFFVSTQANITNTETAKFYIDMGAVRVITAREMSLADTKKMSQEIDTPIEAFCHGAMCYAISGRCILSATLHGTSANCGSCAQPCRQEWTLKNEDGEEIACEGKYLMGSKDMCMIEHIPEMIESGITSFKIEGRRRDPNYIETTTRCYREAVDAYFDGTYTKEKVEKWLEDLKSVYNRGFTTGFYFDTPGPDDQTVTYADNIATKTRDQLGIVTHYYAKPQVALIKASVKDIKIGDTIIFEGKDIYHKQKIVSLEVDNKPVDMVEKGQEAGIKVDQKIKKGTKVFSLSPTKK